jgi:hypothetical protein
MLRESPDLERSWHLVFAGPDSTLAYRRSLER